MYIIDVMCMYMYIDVESAIVGCTVLRLCVCVCPAVHVGMHSDRECLGE